MQNNYNDEVGDAWCFLGIERDPNLILAWHLDKRTTTATLDFACKLRDATTGGFQLTTDGFGPYAHAIPLVFKDEVDFAQLVKTYGKQENVNPSTRYSPSTVTGTQTLVRKGNPVSDLHRYRLLKPAGRFACGRATTGTARPRSARGRRHQHQQHDKATIGSPSSYFVLLFSPRYNSMTLDFSACPVVNNCWTMVSAVQHDVSQT